MQTVIVFVVGVVLGWFFHRKFIMQRLEDFKRGPVVMSAEMAKKQATDHFNLPPRRGDYYSGSDDLPNEFSSLM